MPYWSAFQFKNKQKTYICGQGKIIHKYFLITDVAFTNLKYYVPSSVDAIVLVGFVSNFTKDQ